MSRNILGDDVDAPDAIMHTDPARRLDGIIRRFGGKPSVPARRTAIGSRDPGEGQLVIDDALEADA